MPGTLDLFDTKQVTLSIVINGDATRLHVWDAVYHYRITYVRDSPLGKGGNGAVDMYRYESVHSSIYENATRDKLPYSIPSQVAIKQEYARSQHTGTITVLSEYHDWLPSHHRFVRTVDDKCYIEFFYNDSSTYTVLPVSDKYATDHKYTSLGSTFDIIVPSNSNNRDIHLRIRIFRDKLLSSDQMAAQMLSDVKCRQIKARIIPEHNSPYKTLCFILLYAMRGSMSQRGALAHYASSNGITHNMAAIQIVDEVRQQVMCLLTASESIFYADVKAANVLLGEYIDNNGVYRCTVHLGDIGSIVPNRDGQYICTYPYVRGKGEFKIPHREKEHCLAFLLGILLCDLLGLKSQTKLLSHEYSTDLTALEDNYILNGLRSELVSKLPPHYAGLQHLLYRDNGVKLDVSFTHTSHPQWKSNYAPAMPTHL